MHILSFTDEEHEARRQGYAEVHQRVAGMVNLKQRDRSKSQAEVNEIGLFAEYAIAKYFGLPLSACGVMLMGKAMDGGVDLYVPGVGTFQIKGVRRKNFADVEFWFCLEPDEQFTAQFGAFVYWYPDDTAGIVGVISRARFEQIAEPVDLGTGPRRGVSSYDLKGITDCFPRHAQ